MESESAKELIRKRKAETKAAKENEILESIEKSESSLDTGKNYRLKGRNPNTGTFIVGNDRETVEGFGVSNSEVTKETALQIIDSGGKLVDVNFPPSYRKKEKKRSVSVSSSYTGSLAVLFDCVVQGDAVSSCKTLNDVWALYAIVRYVKPARCLILFSFPVDANTPQPYRCPRYEFGRYGEGGAWHCIPTTDPDALYATAGECQKANPVTCSETGLELVPGIPLNPTAASPNPRYYTYCNPGYRSEILLENVYGKRQTNTIYRGISELFYPFPITTWYDSEGAFSGYRDLVKPSNRGESFILKSAYDEWDRVNSRPAKCGDKVTFSVPVAVRTSATICYLVDRETGGFEPISHSGDFISGISYKTITWSLQPAGTQYLAWRPIDNNYSCRCNSYTAYPANPDYEYATLPPPPTLKGCDPPVAPFSDIKREFWVGGHVGTPIKLAEINEEEDYQVYGTLTSDGYIVTLKSGRTLANGVEKWCKVQQFKTSNLVDWRTEAYTASADLNPSIPTGIIGELISTKNNRANISDQGTHEIDLSQTVEGAGGIQRSFLDEVLTRPEPGSANEKTFMADITYTPTAGISRTVPAVLYRIVDVVPESLNEIVGGCVSVKDLELQFSPLFIDA